MTNTQEQPATICWYCQAKLGIQTPVRLNTPVISGTISPTCDDCWKALNPVSHIQDRFTLCTVCALMIHLKYYAGLSDPGVGAHPVSFRKFHPNSPYISEQFQQQKEMRDREFRERGTE